MVTPVTKKGSVIFTLFQHQVGLLDIDLCGPSIPKMVNLSGHEVHQCEAGWVPVFTDPSQTLAVMSIGFLLNDENTAVVWRGPKKNAMIKQVLKFLSYHFKARSTILIRNRCLTRATALYFLCI